MPYLRDYFFCEGVKLTKFDHNNPPPPYNSTLAFGTMYMYDVPTCLMMYIADISAVAVCIIYTLEVDIHPGALVGIVSLLPSFPHAYTYR